MHIRHSLIPFLFTSIPFSLLAQPTSTVSPMQGTDSVAVVRLGYQRVLNTFTSTGHLRSGGAVSSIAYLIRQDLRSRLVRIPGSPRQDEYAGTVRIEAPAMQGLRMHLLEESSVLGGSRGSGIEAIEMHRVLGGGTVEPWDHVRFQGSAGWEWNAQEQQKDQGAVLHASLDAGGIDVEGIRLNGSASWIRSDLGDRRPEDAHAVVRIRSDFQQGSGDSLVISYRKQVRELYSAIGPSQTSSLSTILRRGEDVLQVRNTLWFLSGDKLSGTIEGGLVQRGIDRAFSDQGQGSSMNVPLPATIDQLMIDIGGRIRWSPLRNVIAHVGTGFSSGEENHDVREIPDVLSLDLDQQRSQARRRSNRFERYSTTLSLDAFPLRKGAVRLQGSASILRYDTPDTLNTDDRDEQRLTAGLQLSYALSDQLGLSVLLEGGQSHLVYLSRFQSANNVRIRTLRLAPSVVWDSPGWFRNTLTAEVAASYTVYDYEDLISTVQSFSYRQAAWIDSMHVTLGTRTGLEFFGSLRLFERGTLRWSDFTERPQRAFLELFLWPRLTYHMWGNVNLGVGFRSFRQERYLYQGRDRVYDSAVGSFGPTVSISAVVGSYGRILLTGWRETQFVNEDRMRSLSNLSLAVETRF